jgi:hypothetical protein
MADGSNRNMVQLTISVEFDRLGGTVKEVVNYQTILEIDAVSSNPYAPPTYKKEIVVPSRITFEGNCVKTTKRF